MASTPEERNHQEWLGYVQPVGLVVSIPALLAAECHINRNITSEHARFLDTLPSDSDESVPELSSLRVFTNDVLGWRDDDLIDIPSDSLPDNMSALEVVLPEYNETLRPTHAVPAYQPDDGEKPWMILVKELVSGIPLDDAERSDGRGWHASPHAKFERLLRETEIPIGLLTNGRGIRLVYAPRGETSGYITFDVAQMATVAGRPIFAAMYMLLCEERLFSLETNQRLPAILENSRKYQNTVSTKLADQVMAALFELLRGFQAAHEGSDGKLLREILAKDPQHVYHGLLTVLMRMVFVLYAEDRGLLSTDAVYANHYSITGLFERLRSDAGRFPDTMDQRYGAWPQLLTLFRIIHEGGRHADFKIPPRRGYLFEPDRYPFLEGRASLGDSESGTETEEDESGDEDPASNSEAGARQVAEHLGDYQATGTDVSAATTKPVQFDSATPESPSPKPSLPRVPDGVVYRVLEDLLILDGERLSYRTLDVEQIGSVYEAIMGFELEVAQGPSIAIKPAKSHGAPSTINLDAVLDAKAADRAKRLKEWADLKVTGEALKELKAAETVEGVLNALDRKIAKNVTPNIVPRGAMVFQPSDERRRSGSHYTPRSLTEPIVKTTLEPILNQLPDSEGNLPAVWEPSATDKKRYTKGEIALRIKASERKVKNAQAARAIGTPHPSQILDLKICDPAMGSGAFLVEACRQLGDELIKAWYAHDAVPTDIPPDEDEVLYARRLIAQRCLYGVDKNVMAVDLAKLSLWLVTLAKDHAFTFLDHALRHGDSLVGLTREQIIGFHWEVKKQKKFGEDLIQRRLDRATEARAKILGAREDSPYRDQQQRMASADEALDLIRLVGDACVSGFFAGQKKKEREEHAERLFGVASSYLESLTAGRGKQVDFESRRVLGQAAARLRAGSHPIPAFHWEIEFPEVFARENGGFDAFVGNPPFLGGSKIWPSFGESFRDFIQLREASSGRAVDLVAHFFRLTFDLLRTGGTAGLIATNTIAQGDTREAGLEWICTHGGNIYDANKRYQWPGLAAVTVSVVHILKNVNPKKRVLNGKDVSEITAFLFHAGGHTSPSKLQANRLKSFNGSKVYGQGFIFEDDDPECTPIARMEELIASDPKNRQRIQPYIGGEEINTHPKQEPHRFVINFEDLPLEEAECWPDLISIVREKVKPGRDKLGGYSVADGRRERWWQFGTFATGLAKAISDLPRCLAVSQVSSRHGISIQPCDRVFSHALIGFAIDHWNGFAVLQSRSHELWARFFGSSMEDRLRYTPSECFETFPFPSMANNTALEEAGKAYFEFRASLMIANEEGFTKTYNRFHDPHEQSEGILELRRLHGLMDGAVLRAYGWDDLAESARCEFLLDYEEEEDDADAGPPAAGTRKKSKKKKPWRLRWPDEFRDEVLARLLELNEQRHKQELLAAKSASGKTAPSATPKKRTSKPKRVAATEQQGPLFSAEDLETEAGK